MSPMDHLEKRLHLGFTEPTPLPFQTVANFTNTKRFWFETHTLKSSNLLLVNIWIWLFIHIFFPNWICTQIQIRLKNGGSARRIREGQNDLHFSCLPRLQFLERYHFNQLKPNFIWIHLWLMLNVDLSRFMSRWLFFFSFFPF
jgi:hypothetical protein